MTSVEILQPPFTDDFSGLCPICHRNDGMLNVGKTHWTVCHTHNVRWSIGTNLFSGWRHETEEDWERNSKLLSTYEDVAPFFYPHDDDEDGDDGNAHKRRQKAKKEQGEKRRQRKMARGHAENEAAGALEKQALMQAADLIRNSLGNDLAELINALQDARVVNLATALSEPINAQCGGKIEGGSIAHVVQFPSRNDQ
ncbi:hypothetical protein ACCT24_34955 [Rhizobium ruizarguesonis]